VEQELMKETATDSTNKNVAGPLKLIAALAWAYADTVKPALSAKASSVKQSTSTGVEMK
jgi:hypothetical protein